VSVPAIVSQELFDAVQERLLQHEARYCKPHTHYLLSRIIQCGVCGSGCSSSRGYNKKVGLSGKVSVYHRSAYRCTRRFQEWYHDRNKIDHCTNSQIGTEILEAHVLSMIREIMLDPVKLRRCMKHEAGLDERDISKELARIATHIKGIDGERRRIIELYASENMPGEEYIAANRALDKDLERLVRRKAETRSNAAFSAA
jgi:hypothetical protein